ncbi:MAG: SPOR domain-containing protein [Acidobacteriota bacterium]|nr:SPOR domain-containing protein [Acidobacteriota bacterium]
MTRTENEQDLVLGNKQLLSAFFVVVALLGVFFTMGYIIGRNTGAKSTKDASADAGPGTAVTANRGLDPVTEHASSRAVNTPSSAVTQEPTTDAAPTRKLREAGEPKTEAEPSTAAATQSAPGHQYLQLMAVKRPVADNMIKLLKGRGFPALLAESSKPELFRVLVGPFADMQTLAKTKSELKSAGFESMISK